MSAAIREAVLREAQAIHEETNDGANVRLRELNAYLGNGQAFRNSLESIEREAVEGLCALRAVHEVYVRTVHEHGALTPTTAVTISRAEAAVKVLAEVVATLRVARQAPGATL